MKNKSFWNFFAVGAVAAVGVLVYYIRNKSRLDYEISTDIQNNAISAVKDKYKSDWNDLLAVAKGEKKFFG